MFCLLSGLFLSRSALILVSQLSSVRNYFDRQKLILKRRNCCLVCPLQKLCFVFNYRSQLNEFSWDYGTSSEHA